MNASAPTTDSASPPPADTSDEAVIIALDTGRFVIQRGESYLRVRACECFCRGGRSLRKGERVYHRGAVATVVAVDRY